MRFRFGGDSSALGSDGSSLGAGGLLGSDAARRGAGQESLLAHARFSQAAAREKAEKTRAGSSGKILGEPNSDGTYEVIDPDGGIHSGCQSRKRAKWQDGQPVTLEWVNGQPQIVGFGPVGF